MTVEQAIEILDHNWTKIANPDYTDEELAKVLDMAIRSLEAWEKVKADLQNERINMIVQAFTGGYKDVFCAAKANGLLMALSIIDKHMKGVIDEIH